MLEFEAVESERTSLLGFCVDEEGASSDSDRMREIDSVPRCNKNENE